MHIGWPTLERHAVLLACTKLMMPKNPCCQKNPVKQAQIRGRERLQGWGDPIPLASVLFTFSLVPMYIPV